MSKKLDAKRHLPLISTGLLLLSLMPLGTASVAVMIAADRSMEQGLVGIIEALEKPVSAHVRAIGSFDERAGIDAYLAESIAHPGDVLAIVDHEGRCLASSDPALRGSNLGEPDPDRPFAPAEQPFGGRALRHDVAMGGDGLHFSYFLSEKVAQAILDDIRGRSALLSLSAMIPTLAFALFLRRAFLKPLREVMATMRRIGEGDFSASAPEGGGAEFRSLARGINDMAAKLASREAELKQSEERYKALFYGSEAPSLLFDAETGNIADANEAAMRLYGYGEDEIRQKTALAIETASAEELAVKYAELLKRGSSKIQSSHKLRDGGTHDVELYATALELAGRRYVHALVFDVTERRAASERLERALEEKIVLLKEVHHRVKNNLQIIISLLRLQEASINDAADLSYFKDTEDRIYSLALTHEMLYQTGDFARIDMARYTETLATHLAGSYSAIDATVVTKAERIELSLDEAIPFGLALSELITNAFKHGAGPEGPRVELRLGSAPGDPGRVVLEVEDEGPGMPESAERWRSGSLGLTLIEALAGQLGGKASWSRGAKGGTLARLEFPLTGT
jgi:PAS domain S-box-containing protein